MLEATDPQHPQKTWLLHQRQQGKTGKKYKKEKKKKEAAEAKRMSSSGADPRKKNKGRAERQCPGVPRSERWSPLPAQPGQRVQPGLAVRREQGGDQNG